MAFSENVLNGSTAATVSGSEGFPHSLRFTTFHMLAAKVLPMRYLEKPASGKPAPYESALSFRPKTTGHPATEPPPPSPCAEFISVSDPFAPRQSDRARMEALWGAFDPVSSFRNWDRTTTRTPRTLRIVRENCRAQRSRRQPLSQYPSPIARHRLPDRARRRRYRHLRLRAGGCIAIAKRIGATIGVAAKATTGWSSV